MANSFMLHAMLVLSVILSMVISDAAWSLSEEFSAPEIDLPLNDEMIAFDQSTLPMDLNVAPQDGSDLFFQDVDNGGLISNDDTGVGESWELADCSSSELFPLLGKSRMRRRDESTGCKNPTSTPPTGTIPPFDASRNLFGSQGMMQLFNSVRMDRVPNNVCVYMSMAVLPFAVCHSGIDASSTTVTVTIAGKVFLTVNLQHCSPALGAETTCPHREKFYCCHKVFLDENDVTNIRGDVCVSISELMGEPQL